MRLRLGLATLVLLAAGGAFGEAYSQNLPDLVVAEIRLNPQSPKPLEQTEVRATVRNVGSAPSGPFRVSLSVDGKYVSKQRVEGLNPQETAQVAFIWFAPQGRRTVRVEADAFEEVVESHEDNNALEIGVDVFPEPLPDLVVESIRTQPQHPQPGGQVTLEVAVRNVGLLTPTTRASLQLKSRGSVVSTLFVNPLAPGASVMLQSSWVPREGENYLSAQVDAQGRVPELDELNNLLILVLNVSATPFTGANLVVEDLQFSSSSTLPEEPVIVQAAVRNAGQGAAAPFAVRFEADGAPIGVVSVDGLAAGQARQVQVAWSPPTSGEHVIRVKADEKGAVVELDEEDNFLFQALEVGPAINNCGQTVYLELEEGAAQILALLLSLTLEEVRDVFMPQVKAAMETDFEGINIRFALSKPALPHSTLAFVADDPADRLGEAPVDLGNTFRNDRGTVFIGTFRSVLGRTPGLSPARAVLAVVNTASHEVGHFLGLFHDDAQTTQRFAGKNLMADGLDAPSSSLFTDSFFTEENLDYLRRTLPLTCNR